MPEHGNKKRGLASADEHTREEVARKGGRTVSQNREHMAEIGRKGGETVSQNREHMAEIGKKGGRARSSGGQKKEEFTQPPRNEPPIES